MFFTMLKNDLKQNKGLNLILFLFMTAAAALVFISSVQLYSELTGRKRTNDICRLPDTLLLSDSGAGGRAEKDRQIRQLLNEESNVRGYAVSEVIRLRWQLIDFADFSAEDCDNFYYSTHLLSKMPRDADLVYDINDKPFYVESGTIALPLALRDMTGAKTGDTLRLTTEKGSVYEFRIARFYKENFDQKLRYLVSDADYELLSAEYPVKTDVYGLYLYKTDSASHSAMMTPFSKVRINYQTFRRGNLSNDEVMMYIISAAMAAISVFAILIILMTVRFTMISAMKAEEKEIGMMRAIGVDSFSFRWLFAAKYIGFAVIGGILGIAAGLPLSRAVLRLFSNNVLFPPFGIILMIGVISVLVLIGIMILFAMLMMRRIRRISVMDALRGTSPANAAGKDHNGGMLLQKRRKMPVPLYLALTDLWKQKKRYLFLVLSYTFGAVIMLTVVYLRHTCISLEYMQYWGINHIDFSPDFSPAMEEEYSERSIREGKYLWELVNEDLEQADIPAHVNTYYSTFAEWQTGEQIIRCSMRFGDRQNDRYLYTAGSRVPEKENEIAISDYSASLYGTHIGDTVTLTILEWDDSEGEMHIKKHDSEFVVTGLLRYMEMNNNQPLILCGLEYERAAPRGMGRSGIYIDAPESERDAVFSRIEALYGAEHVMDQQEYIRYQLADYDKLFTQLIRIMSSMVIVVTLLITVLYLNIFISEDQSEIALLRAVGFSGGSLRLWLAIRMLLLTVGSAAAGILLANTAVQALGGLLFRIVRMNGFRFRPDWLFTFAGMPVILLAAVMLPALLKLRQIQKINLRSMTDE